MPVFSGTAVADWILGSATADKIYGLDGNDTLYGSGGDDLLAGGKGDDVLGGGKGNDVYEVGSAGDQVREREDEGVDRVHSWVSYQLTANVENLTLMGSYGLTGTGNDLANTIIGNAGNNVLNGGAGDDTLVGGKGSDLLVGGQGNDIYDVDSTGDRIQEAANEGTDRVRASISFTLGADLEDLTLTGTAAINGTGNALANAITGNAGNNVLNGGAGDDTLVGGKGNDLLVGGQGNDIYDVDSTGDRIQEAANEGTDRVQASISFTLGADLEDLTLTGTAAINGTGNAVANAITGNAGNNVLNGGAGDDVLAGGKGNDIYYVGAPGDRLVELANEGIDRVLAWVSHQLAANVENLILQGTDRIGGTGNALANTIFGNVARNLMDGGEGNDALLGAGGDDQLRGETGNDTLSGGDGDDLLFGDEGDDLIQGDAGADQSIGGDGNDHLIGGAGDDQLRGGTGKDALSGGDGDDQLFGDEGDDVIQGGAGADRLTGGDGNDRLIGGTGDDVYVFTHYAFSPDNAVAPGDSVIEAAGEGVDEIVISDPYGSYDYKLAANIENLTLRGDSFLRGFGNASNNILQGGSYLDGGAGDDTLIGGAHTETYIVDSAGDVVIHGSARTAKILASVSYTLPDLVQFLFLTGTGDLNGTGNELDNWLYGNSGRNILDGGAGDDTISIREGDVVAGDSYIGGAGMDTLYITYNLGFDPPLDMSHVTLSGIEIFSGPAYNVLMTISQIVQFESIYSGRVIFVDGGVIDLTHARTVSVSVFQLSDQGNTLLLPQDGYVFGGASGDVISAASGRGFSYFFGYGGDDTLIGGMGSDRLDGGDGADQLTGGSGDDYYIVDSANDRVIELAGGGTDEVASFVSFTLGENLEALRLEGAAAIGGVGNLLNNTIIGNGAVNSLEGGSGNDLLFGGAGGDSFVYRGGNSGIDTINDFASWQDDKLVFDNLLHGAFTYLGSSAFTASGNSEARFASGQVLVDTDGNGTADITIKLTGFTAASQLHASDFVFS
ncbi:hypothetical protein KXS07_11090 [Inquilinus limosus]|uniref:calcium-binding protein n=1 Tax=Inquilinus limosus TaxID=171674 RepID=UPI003F1571FE